MPFIRCEIARKLPTGAAADIDVDFLKMMERVASKPPEYVMIQLRDGQRIHFRGETRKAAFVELKQLGSLALAQKEELSRDICSILDKRAGIPPDHCYITFAEFDRENWGHDGKTFAG